MYATNDVQGIAIKIQRYSDRLRSELFKAATKRKLVAFYNRPHNLELLWLRIEEANRCRLCDGFILND